MNEDGENPLPRLLMFLACSKIFEDFKPNVLINLVLIKRNKCKGKRGDTTRKEVLENGEGIEQGRDKQTKDQEEIMPFINCLFFLLRGNSKRSLARFL